MLIFNTTLHLEESVHDQCLQYLKETYIPRSLAGNLVQQPSLCRIESIHEESGVSYAIQLKAPNMETLEQWMAQTGQQVQKDLSDKFGNKVTTFATLLEEIPL